MNKRILIGGGLLLGVMVLALAIGGYLAWRWRSPTLVTQSSDDPIVDPDVTPNAYLCRLTFREQDGRAWQYGVVTYGRKVSLEPGLGSFKVFVDGRAVEISPDRDGLWAIGPDLKLHRTGQSFEEVSRAMDQGTAGKFVRGSLWKDQLKPKLEKHRWPLQ